MPSLGQTLKEMRIRQALSIRELARRSGVSQPTLSRWEQGLSTPRIPELEAVVATLGEMGTSRKALIALVNAPRALRRIAAEFDQDSEMFIEVVGPPPTAGDLLRAIRQRSGRTLKQLSRSGVSAASISRWENVKNWPAQQPMAAYCVTLEATSAETAFLTGGRYPQLTSVRVGETDRNAVHTAMQSLSANERFEECDLNYLALWAEAWSPARESRPARDHLRRILLAYSAYLAKTGRKDKSELLRRRSDELSLLTD